MEGRRPAEPGLHLDTLLPVAGDDLLDAQAAARYLGLGPNEVNRLIADGTLPASGRPRRIRRSDLDDYVRRSRLQPGQLRHLNQYPSDE